ncbi:glycerol-3-phosphate dehydrogenase [Lentibacter algarum]|uniref:glycerol-3-phosphate dehydrogenase n=1 Tax=Lentibacter algarum TaxID=576131 RepID=UPI001C08EA91|nr:glycerol-3-phosphate dehydrogenase [Lentibacter algarum]MBU2982412.1 glycerol-3-phosphate dehydrogenase [Lentibacter algarum]
MSREPETVYDVFIIGGGVNGCGIARDAAGRGLSVCLAEQGDLASGTSSASTKLFHGGLRYLEYFEFRLVREALKEREVLLRNMPHISWPMRFVLPLSNDMRFEGGTPSSKLLGLFMPWLKGRRPNWLIRLGLFLYDSMGGRKILPATTRLSLANSPEGKPLKAKFRRAYEYSDCWVDDARLVALNARDAAKLGADIRTRCKVLSAKREGALWHVNTEQGVLKARALVNAAGPWVSDVLDGTIETPMRGDIRLVRGSHIVTRKLYDHNKCYFFQGSDGRIIFAIPYEQDFTLIGTTDAEHDRPDARAVCTPEEQQYLLDFANRYFEQGITEQDIVWTYSGVRPLQDEGAGDAAAATRDYELRLEGETAPLLTVFGGKITTYRKLAEAGCEKLSGFFEQATGAWTQEAALPGGDFDVQAFDAEVARLQAMFGFLEADQTRRLMRAYGLDAQALLAGANKLEDLGEAFGAGLTAREVDWLVEHEFAREADDILWRRSKLGLKIDAKGRQALEAYLQKGA